MQSTTREPSPVEGYPGTKLRTTCDSCAASKVKCNQQKPSCRRCIGLNLDCVYGRSRRKGKPSSVGKNANRAPRSAEIRSPKDLKTSNPSMSSLPPYDWWGSNMSGPCSTIPPVRDEDTAMSSDFLDGNFYKFTTPLTLGSAVEPLIIQADWTDHVTSMITDDHSASLSHSNRTRSLSERALAEFTDAAANTDTTGDACSGTAIRTLQSLYQLGSQHQSSNSTLKPTSDQILKTNRLAVQNLETLLQCTDPTCQRDYHIRFLLATICSKVLSWYRAVYSGIVHDEPHDHDEQQLLLTPTSEEAGAGVSVTAITIGDFQLDYVAETRMKAQLLLCELQNVQKVFDALARSQNRETTAAAGGDVVVVGRQRGVHDAFDQFLRSNLNDMVARLNGFCILKY